MSTTSDVKLTQYSHGAGCGCKIAPAVLDQILAGQVASVADPSLLVGNEKRDDAAVVDLGDGSAIVSTTDFFMPIVDDARDFGRIASVNAISDIYAMGGTPIVAIAVLGWPLDQLPPEVARDVVDGAREACTSAGIALAGGHSIDSPEPIFGLAVTGRVQIANLKKNEGARVGDRIFLTKPLGVGILTTAQKQGKLQDAHATLARDSMVALNDIGAELGGQSWVNAMTDVTGFGLLGHLSEMCEASDVTARVEFAKVPRIESSVVDEYIEAGCIPGGTNRNWKSYGHKIGEISDHARKLLCDPQTSGGLLVAVAPESVGEMEALAAKRGLSLTSFGTFEARGEKLVEVG